jgi:hypothetical protein
MKTAREQKGLSCRALAGKLAHGAQQPVRLGKRQASCSSAHPGGIRGAAGSALRASRRSAAAGRRRGLRDDAASTPRGASRGGDRQRREGAPLGPAPQYVVDGRDQRWCRAGHAWIGPGPHRPAASSEDFGNDQGLRNASSVPRGHGRQRAVVRRRIIATVTSGDLFDARTTNGMPYYAHRYYGVVLRTGVWGYVDSKKLVFVKDACFP